MSNFEETPCRLNEVADEIGTLRAAIAEQQAELKALEAEAKESGFGVINGELFRVSISWSDRKTIAWKAIAEKLGVSNQMIAGNTKKSEVCSLRCTARLKTSEK